MLEQQRADGDVRGHAPAEHRPMTGPTPKQRIQRDDGSHVVERTDEPRIVKRETLHLYELGQEDLERGSADQNPGARMQQRQAGQRQQQVSESPQRRVVKQELEDDLGMEKHVRDERVGVFAQRRVTDREAVVRRTIAQPRDDHPDRTGPGRGFGEDRVFAFAHGHRHVVTAAGRDSAHADH